MQVLEKIGENGIVFREVVYEEVDMMGEVDKVLNRNICFSCEFYNNETCSACGCLINSLLFLKTSKCPEGKW